LNSFDKIFEASQRKCGACGETGHNARTCKSKSVPFSTGGYWNEKTFDGLEQLGLPFVDSSHVAMISKIVDGEVLKEPNARVQMPRITWKEEPIKMTWGELDEKCKKQDLVSIGESTYSGAYLRGALAYLPKNTVLTLYTGVHYPLKATFEYGGEEWIFFLAPRVENWYAENLEDWSEQEMTSHGKNVSFKDFIKKEIKSHGNIDIVDWAKHEKQSHKERYGVESFSLDSKRNQSKYMAQDKTWQEKRGYTDDEMAQAQYPNYFLLQKYGNDTDAFFSDKLYRNLFIGLSGVDNRTLDILEDVIYYEPEENMVDKFKLTMDNAREYRKLYYNIYGKYPTAFSSSYYVAETFGAEYDFTGRLKKYSFEEKGRNVLFKYGHRILFELERRRYFNQFNTPQQLVDELNNNQERAVSDVFNFLWNKTNNGHLDDILMNRAETFGAEREDYLKRLGNIWYKGSSGNEDFYGSCYQCKNDLSAYDPGYVASDKDFALCMPCFGEGDTPKLMDAETFESEERMCLVCGCKEDLVFCCGDYWCNDERCSTKERRSDEPYPKSEESCWAKHADYGYCDGGWRNAETESLIEEPDFIPDGDGRALGQQTSSINLSPLHAETEEAFGSVGEGNDFGQMRAENKVLSKTNLVIAGVIGLGIWKGKQILDTAKSSLKQSAENKKERCSTCNSNGTIRKNHTQVKQSEYSVNQINPVEAEGQNDIHGAEGVTNPRHAPNSQPFGYPSKSLKMW